MGKRTRSQRDRQAQRYRVENPERLQPLPAGSHLGELGEEHDEVDIAFGWFGASIRINPEIGGLDVVDFMEAGMEIDEEDPRQATMLKDFMRAHIHPEDFDEFWKLARRKRQDGQDLMKLSAKILEAVSGHPTGRQSDSSDGQSTTPRTYVDASFEQVDAPSDLTSRVVARLEAEGRADLAEAVLMRHEHSLAG